MGQDGETKRKETKRGTCGRALAWRFLRLAIGDWDWDVWVGVLDEAMGMGMGMAFGVLGLG